MEDNSLQTQQPLGGKTPSEAQKKMEKEAVEITPDREDVECASGGRRKPSQPLKRETLSAAVENVSDEEKSLHPEIGDRIQTSGMNSQQFNDKTGVVVRVDETEFGVVAEDRLAIKFDDEDLGIKAIKKINLKNVDKKCDSHKWNPVPSQIDMDRKILGRSKCKRCKRSSAQNPLFRCQECDFILCSQCKPLDKNPLFENWPKIVDEAMCLFAGGSVEGFRKFICITYRCKTDLHARMTVDRASEKSKNIESVLQNFGNALLARIGGIKAIQEYISNGDKQMHEKICLLIGIITETNRNIRKPILKSPQILRFLVEHLSSFHVVIIFSSFRNLLVQKPTFKRQRKHLKTLASVGLWEKLRFWFINQGDPLSTSDKCYVWNVVSIICLSYMYQHTFPLNEKERKFCRGIINQMWGRELVEFFASYFIGLDETNANDLATLQNLIMNFMYFLEAGDRYKDDMIKILKDHQKFQRKLQDISNVSLLREMAIGMQDSFMGKFDGRTFVLDPFAAGAPPLVGSYEFCCGPKCSVVRNHITGILPFKVCSGCHIARYCSVECQKAHWKEHKNDCKLYH